MKLDIYILLVVLFFGFNSFSQSIENVTNGDSVLFNMASYSTPGHEWYVTMASWWACSHPDQTNDLSNISRSGESWGGLYASEEQKWGNPLWSVHTNLLAQEKFIEPSDDNGGYNTTNAAYTNGLLIATAPQMFFNGTAATNEGYNYPLQFDSFGNPIHDSSDGDSGAIARNTACLMLQTNFNRLPVDLWHTVWTNGWQTDVTGARLLGFSTGSHPYQGGFVALTIAALKGLGADTNVGSLVIDYNSLTVATNHFAVTGVVNDGSSITMTARATRMPFGWIEVPGNYTNQGSMCFQGCPVFAGWFHWVIQGTNFPSAASIQIKVDGQTIDNMSGSQFNSSGENMFTNMNNQWWVQRHAVVEKLCDKDGVDYTNLFVTHDAGSGGVLGPDNINYQSNAAQQYDVLGKRGSTYVSAMSSFVADLEVYDAAIYQAAQQTNHTVTIQYGPFIGGKMPFR